MPPKSRKSDPAKKSSDKKPKSGRPSRGAGYPLKALIAALVLLAFLVVSLVYLSQFRKPQKGQGTQTPATVEREEPRGKDVAPPPEGDLQLEDLLPAEEGAPPLPSPSPEEKAPPPPPPSPETRPLRPIPLPRAEGEPARIAIVMDDLGRDMATGRALVDIGIPVTFAILPDLPQAARLAEYAHQNGREIIIHIPMEPRGYPVTNPGDEALFTQLSPEEVRTRMKAFIARVPHAVGGNNHMGSRFTEDREGMRAALAVLKEGNLFFLDSLTSGNSVGYDEARQAGIPSTVRDVFLDNEKDVRAISAQIARLVQVAQKQGEAVGICHPYPQTLAALRAAAPEFARQGVEVVPVSALLKR